VKKLARNIFSLPTVERQELLKSGRKRVKKTENVTVKVTKSVAQ